MVYLYDKAICSDLNDSLGSDTVRVIDPEGAVDIIAQIQNDQIQFPVIVMTRDGNYSIDESRMNYTLAHKGIPASIDLETNMIYNEKVLPINLNYNLTVLATNTADMDELLKELMFKYLHQFFLTIQLPYESDRKIRFGISITPNTKVEQTSGSVEYIKSGSLYQSILPLQTFGCVLLSYTPHRLHRIEQPEIIALSRKQAEPLRKESERKEIYNEVQKFRTYDQNILRNHF